MGLYQTSPKKTSLNYELHGLLTTLLPSRILGATKREEMAYKQSYASHIALKHCTWIQYNQDWVNTLIFDLDYSITSEDAWLLCVDKLGTHPSWVCTTTKGVQIGFVLENRIKYEWEETILLARRVKKAITKVLEADTKGSHRLLGWWRNPVTHQNYFDGELRIALKDFYHLLPKRSPTQRFKTALIKQQRKTQGFGFKEGYRNEWLWFRGMQVTKNKDEFKELMPIVSLLSSMQGYQVQYNEVKPLDREEIHRIAESILQYNIGGKNFVSTGDTVPAREINEGVMEFETMRNLSKTEYDEETKRRQRLSAKRTNKGRDMATRIEHIEKVNSKRKEDNRRTGLNCITGMFAHEYQKKSGAWHLGKIAKETGLSTKTISNFLKEYQDENNH